MAWDSHFLVGGGGGFQQGLGRGFCDGEGSGAGCDRGISCKRCFI